MKQRIIEREINATVEATEIIKARTADIKEVNRMMREMIASIHAMNEELAAARRARRNGESNE